MYFYAFLGRFSMVLKGFTSCSQEACFPLQVTLVSRVFKKIATSTCKIKPFFLAYGFRHVENYRSNCDVRSGVKLTPKRQWIPIAEGVI